MLVLPVQSAGELITLRDDTLPGRTYVALARPKIACTSDGRPRCRLLRWVAPSGDKRIVGARLALDVDLAPTPAQIAVAGLDANAVLPLPWLDAAVRLEGPQFDTVEAEVALAGTHVGAFSVDLSPAAASILAPLLQGDHVMPLQVTWSGHVQVRLPPVEVIASADVAEVRRRIALTSSGGDTTITRSIIDANMHVEIRGAGRPEIEQALREWVLDEFTRRLESGASLVVHASASDVVRWPIRLATTLDDFLPAGTRGSLVETLVLDAHDIGAVPPIEVQVVGDFGTRLERVDVRLQPKASEAVTDRSFVDQVPQRVALGTTEFRWAHRVKLANRAAGPWSAWSEVHHGTGIVIPVPTPASVALEAVAIGVDFERRWAAATVVAELAMLDGPPVAHTVELDASHPSRTWTLALDGARGTLSARITYVSRQGETVESRIDNVAGDQIIVSDPYAGSAVTLAVMPAGGGWKDVALAMVDLRYADGPHVVEETVELRSLDDFVEWRAPARPDGPRLVQWRLHASFDDGRFESRPWQSTDSGVAVVTIEAVARRTVQILPIYFDPNVARKAVVRLRGETQDAIVTIADRAVHSLSLGPGPFTWTIAWTAADGSELPESNPQPGADVIVVPRFVRG